MTCAGWGRVALAGRSHEPPRVPANGPGRIGSIAIEFANYCDTDHRISWSIILSIEIQFLPGSSHVLADRPGIANRHGTWAECADYRAGSPVTGPR